MTAKTVLVTGGCGFIGSHLVEALVNRGFRVRILDNLSSGRLDNIAALSPRDVEVCIGDVIDFAKVELAMQGCDYVFHEAAIASVPESIRDPIGTGKVNYGGTLNVLEAAHQHQVRRVIFASSVAVYGDEPTLPKHELMSAQPLTPYAANKLASEVIGQIYQRIFGLEFVALRYANVFGRRQDPSSPYSGAISIFCDYFLRGQAPTIYGDGRQSRDFIHVSDVVEANLLAMVHPMAAGQVFNVGRGIATSLLDIVDILNHLTHQLLQPHFGEPRVGDIRHSLTDITALKALGWLPARNITESLSELLKR